MPREYKVQGYLGRTFFRKLFNNTIRTYAIPSEVLDDIADNCNFYLLNAKIRGRYFPREFFADFINNKERAAIFIYSNANPCTIAHEFAHRALKHSHNEAQQKLDDLEKEAIELVETWRRKRKNEPVNEGDFIKF